MWEGIMRVMWGVDIRPLNRFPVFCYLATVCETNHIFLSASSKDVVVGPWWKLKMRTCCSPLSAVVLQLSLIAHIVLAGAGSLDCVCVCVCACMRACVRACVLCCSNQSVCWRGSSFTWAWILTLLLVTLFYHARLPSACVDSYRNGS